MAIQNGDKSRGCNFVPATHTLIAMSIRMLGAKKTVLLVLGIADKKILLKHSNETLE